VWSYRGSLRSGLGLWMAFALKLLAVGVLALCLVEPLWSGRRVKSGANLFLVVADNSRSMAVSDRGVAQTRGQVLRSALQTHPESWLARLGETYQVRQYVLDSRLRRTADFSELAFDGKASNMGTALRTLAERYRGRPVAGVLLMTDGIATDGDGAPADLSGLAPIYPVPIGGDEPSKDVAVRGVSVTQTAFEDAPVLIQAEVEAVGCAGRTLAVRLTDEAGVQVEGQEVRIRSDDEKQVFRFRLRPDRTGVLFYRIQATDVQTGPADQAEATLANNDRTVVVDRGGGPYRILYVAGRPNWEYKFLQRVIRDEEQVQLVGLLRVAKREPKYDWRGRRGEQTNPLYRGYDVKEADQAESYDQPVLVRLNTLDEAELRDGFPKTAGELFRYHAILLDDVEAEFFTRDQMDLIRRFVAERGGGLMMLGGRESFVQGGYERTPIGALLPVGLDRAEPGRMLSSSLQVQLTREGWLEPWVRLRDQEQAERERLARMPTFQVFNRVRGPRPGASVLATVGDEQTGVFPALAVQRFGRGRAAALMVGDVWRWGMERPEARPDMERFWRQTLRWLVADVPDPVTLQAVVRSDPADPAVVLQVRARDPGFEPADNCSVALEVRDPGGQTARLAAEPVAGESGLFEAAYVPRSSGGHLARAVVTDLGGGQAGPAARTAEAGWAADLDSREFQSIRVNRPLLARIAAQTGGQVVELDQLGAFAGSLPGRHAPVSEVWVRPLWDLPWIRAVLFLSVLAGLILEWALRRWKGLP
ncbi:MAG: hypothetical protein KBE04_03835, partial [Phycisphaerae bacterium]|nr:hypothetical protein [Phycisphaerae bacterium]